MFRAATFPEPSAFHHFSGRSINGFVGAHGSALEGGLCGCASGATVLV